jgi:hypothetical protein
MAQLPSRLVRPLTHDPALEAHEHLESAEHAGHAHDPFLAKVSITVAVMAVLAAGVGSLETVEAGRAITSSSEAVLAQDKATDAWDEYQADSLKKHIYDLAADNLGPNAERYRAEAKSDADKQAKVRKEAADNEKERDALLAASRKHEDRHHWLTGAATILEIGIAVSTMAIITRRRYFWLGALGCGAVGLALFAAGYLAV